MATEPYLGEIRLFAFGFAPKGWQPCNGQLLAINQYQALFAILGTTYGGNGVQNFALPNLQGAVAIHQGASTVIGSVGGSKAVALNGNQCGHTHLVSANATANSFAAAGNFPASAPNGQTLYGPTPGTAMSSTLLSPNGESVPHNNMQPYLVLNYCIALVGIFPTRN